MPLKDDALKFACLLEAMARGYAGGHSWDRLDGDACMRTAGVLRRLICAPAAATALPAWWPDFITNVCEIPDRNSPEDEPDAMIATAKELEGCALRAIEAYGAAPQAAPVPAPTADDNPIETSEADARPWYAGNQAHDAWRGF